MNKLTPQNKRRVIFQQQSFNVKKKKQHETAAMAKTAAGT